MSDQLKIQAVVEMSAEGAENALDRVGEKAGQMADRLQREGTKAGAAVDSIGTGADKSAEQFSRAEGKIAASIKRATTNLEQLGKTASQKLEFQINEKGLDANKFQPLLAKLRELEAANVRVGMSAAQTTAALRNVPAQMTDIVVSLQGGQKPMTVLLQQGGQLKDMFGGVGAAAKAVGGYVVSLINPFTLAAAAAAGIGYAFYSGASEADEFRKNLVITGNAAGLTVDRFNAMSKAIGGIDGVTRGAAAEALTAVAASGNISAASMERLTATALRFQQAGGPAVADTVKQFEALGKEPLKASIELSDKTHYLTLEVYEQIKALEQQGKTSEAAAVAQKDWADAIDQRTPQMVQNLGYLETALDNIKRSAAGVWDWVKDIGRDSTSAEMMSALKNKIAEADKDIASGSINSNRLKQQREQWKAELAELVSANIAKEGEAARHAEAQKKEEARIAANVVIDKLIDSQRTKRQQYADDLKKLDAQRTGDLISEEKYQQAKAALAKKYEEKPKAAKADKVDNAYQSILDSLNKQLGSAEKLNAVEKLNVELQEKKYAKLSPLQKENLLLIAQQIDLQKRAEVEGKATLQWIADGADAQKKAVKSLNDELEKSSREVATYGMSRGEIAEYDLRLIDEQIAAERALNEEIGVGGSEALRQLELQRSKRRQILDDARKLDQLDAGKKAAEEAKRAAEEAAAAWQKTVDTIDKTFHDAFVDMIDQGKADWDGFTRSIAKTFKATVADEIYKLTLRPMVLQVAGAFSGNPAADAGQSVGMLAGLQNAYAGVTGGVSNAANSFAMSGMGQWAGLSGPVAMGPPTAAGSYGVANGLTGAGSAFAASAAPAAAVLAAAYVTAEMNKAGWGRENNSRGYLTDLLTFGIGSSVGIDRLFGHNRNVSNDAQGITGTFDLSGFTGQSYQDKSQKGGTFSKDKRWTDYSAIGSDMDKALDSMLKQAVSGVQTIGKALNVETEAALQGFSHTFALQLSDNGDMSKAGEKIAAEIKKVQDELATRLVPNIEEFARYGESASDTFSRLNQEITATDAILLAMGKDASEAFGGVGLASISAREALIDLAGGLDKLASKTQFFYSNFYSQSEQVQLAGKQAQKVLDAGFADLGLTLPTDTKGFRALVEQYGADLSNEASRKMFNALLDLSDEFKAVADAADDAGAGSKKLADAAKQVSEAAAGQLGSIFDTFANDSQKLASAQQLVNSTFASIGKSVPASAEEFLSLAQSIDPATEAGQGLIAALAKVSNAFAYVEKSVSDSTANIAAAAARAAEQVAQATASRRSVLDQFDKAGAVSRAQADIDAAFAKYGAVAPTTREGVAAVAGKIDVNTALGQEQMAALQSITSAFDTVFSAQEKAAEEAAAAAKAASDDMLRNAQAAASEQIRLASQVHDSISSALKSLLGQSETLESQTRQQAQATLQTALAVAKAGGSLANFSGLEAALESVTKLEKGAFSTALGYAREFGKTANVLTQLEQYTRINGSHAEGLDYVPFDGYVAQLHRGERVQTAASAAAADATANEVKALRADLNAIGAALATNTQKTAKLMEKFDVIGLAARV